eukprot:COSAG02_NODE_77080_length_128_cov_731.482759_1_plen_41_part_01
MVDRQTGKQWLDAAKGGQIGTMKVRHCGSMLGSQPAASSS